MDKTTHQDKAKSAPDWERIELDYRAGIKTLRQIADENGISHTLVARKAKSEGWTRDLSHRGIRSQEPVRLVEADEMSKAGFVYVIYKRKGQSWYERRKKETD